MKNFQALLATVIVAGSVYGAFSTQIMVYTDDSGPKRTMCMSIGAIPAGSKPCDGAGTLDRDAPVTVISQETDSVVYSFNPASVPRFGGLLNTDTTNTVPSAKYTNDETGWHPKIVFTVDKLIVVQSLCWNSSSSTTVDSGKFYSYGNGEANNFACIQLDGTGGNAMITPSFYTNSGFEIGGSFKKSGSSKPWSDGDSVLEFEGMKVMYGSFVETHKFDKSCKICFPVNSLSLAYKETSTGIEITNARVVV